MVEVYFRMYSIYEGGFYGDYYSGAVMCGTMSEPKRVTRKYVLKSKYLRGIWSGRGLHLCGYAMVASIQARHNVFSLIDCFNHIFIKSYLFINTTAAHPLQSHTPSSTYPIYSVYPHSSVNTVQPGYCAITLLWCAPSAHLIRY